jgi:hypothetical protein
VELAVCYIDGVNMAILTLADEVAFNISASVSAAVSL